MGIVIGGLIAAALLTEVGIYLLLSSRDVTDVSW